MAWPSAQTPLELGSGNPEADEAFRQEINSYRPGALSGQSSDAVLVFANAQRLYANLYMLETGGIDGRLALRYFDFLNRAIAAESTRNVIADSARYAFGKFLTDFDGKLSQIFSGKERRAATAILTFCENSSSDADFKKGLAAITGLISEKDGAFSAERIDPDTYNDLHIIISTMRHYKERDTTRRAGEAIPLNWDDNRYRTLEAIKNLAKNGATIYTDLYQSKFNPRIEPVRSIDDIERAPTETKFFLEYRVPDEDKMAQQKAADAALLTIVASQPWTLDLVKGKPREYQDVLDWGMKGREGVASPSHKNAKLELVL